MDKAFKVSFAKAQSVLNKFRYKPRKQWSDDDRVLFKLCNFAVLSRKRLNQILLSLDKLSKLSDKSHYKYNELDIKLLKELILEKLDICFEKFKHKISVIKESDLQKIKEHLNSIKNENGLVYYTDLIDFIKPYREDYSAISRYAVNCKDENQKWLSLTTFSKGMGKGDINNQSNPNEIIFPQSNTIYFFIIKNVCNFRKQ